MKTLVLSFAVLALGPGLRAAGHDPHCGDRKASQVDAEISYSGSPRTCGIGLVVFGVGGGIFGETCHPLKILTPAHQECLGDENPGTECLPDGELPVMGSECECGGLVLPILQIGIPTTCECDALNQIGTVEDFATVPCD